MSFADGPAADLFHMELKAIIMIPSSIAGMPVTLTCQCTSVQAPLRTRFYQYSAEVVGRPWWFDHEKKRYILVVLSVVQNLETIGHEIYIETFEGRYKIKCWTGFYQVQVEEPELHILFTQANQTDLLF